MGSVYDKDEFFRSVNMRSSTCRNYICTDSHKFVKRKTNILSSFLNKDGTPMNGREPRSSYRRHANLHYFESGGTGVTPYYNFYRSHDLRDEVSSIRIDTGLTVKLLQYDRGGATVTMVSRPNFSVPFPTRFNTSKRTTDIRSLNWWNDRMNATQVAIY